VGGPTTRLSCTDGDVIFREGEVSDAARGPVDKVLFERLPSS
jgi:hypothetical protein